MKKGIFISGTATDVGKTYISALILKQLRSQGLNAGYFKAASSGGLADAEEVCRICELSDSPASLVPYVYQTPVSPHLAAQLEGNPLNLQSVKKHLNSLPYDFIVAEGAGGLVCPLRYDDKRQIMLIDIIKLTRFPLLIVANSGLGAINAAVLTATYASAQKIPIKGFVLNRFVRGNFMHEDNKNMIESLTGLPVLACVEENCKSIYL